MNVADPIIRDILQNTLTECKKDILDAYNFNPPTAVASGKTGQSLEIVQISDTHAQLWGAKYIDVLDTGRKAGKVPRGFYRIIREWALAKGISFATERELNTFSYFVAKKIKEHGTALYRRGGRTDILQDNISKMQDNIQQQVADRLLNFVNTYIDVNLFNKIKK